MKSLESMFSKQRLDSYASAQEHFANLELIGRIAPMLLMIEICLRNSIDNRLGGVASNWLYDSQEDFIQEAIKKENDNLPKHLRGHATLSHHQLISKFSFGFWLKVLDRVQNIGVFVDVSAIDLQKYYAKNNEIVNNRKISDYAKIKAIFSLVCKIRNRAFHAENLKKLDDRDMPVIRAKFGKNVFRVEGSKIEEFLQDVFKLFEMQDSRVGNSKIPTTNAIIKSIDL
ncbi:hypothetical protein BKN38_03385 [Helicobacter sp. CLO-3]|nr:hypothetical protein [Helicobacter sp. CLO-3]OBV28494.1 hypothetical protein BA723_01960 [Helicobacter sp. CLO-3]OHU84193.1 hypothetical protein BKN38_03385 [Helicobacter sp. CLO-3]